MIELILRFFDCFAWLLGLLGANYEQFRAILGAKLMVDTRRRSGTRRDKTGNKPANYLAVAMATNAFMGIFIAVAAWHAQSPLVGYAIVHTVVLVMISTAVIAEFSSLLLDTTDNAILQPRPVSGRTILLARTAHIATYLTLLSVSLSLASIIAGTIRIGPLFIPVYFGTLVCSMTLVIFVTNVFYLAAMRTVDSERFRDLIVYVQIVLTVAIIGGYQIMPHLMDMRRLKTLSIDAEWWIYLYPPAWLAAPIDLVAGHMGRPQWILSALAVVVPLSGMFVVVRFLAPGFGRALARLEVGGTSGGGARAGSRPWIFRFSCWISRRRSERAAFEFLWILIGRDRPFKRRTYPNVALILMMPMILLLSGSAGGSIQEVLARLPETNQHLFLLYLPAVLASMSIMQLRYGDQYEAIWLFLVVPLERIGDVLMASLKVLMVRITIPVFGVVSVLILSVWGSRVLLDIVLAACVNILFVLLTANLIGRCLPFSEAPSAAAGSGRVGKSLLLMGVPVVAGFSHYALRYLNGGVVVAIPLVLLLCALPYRAYVQTPWRKVLDAAD